MEKFNTCREKSRFPLEIVIDDLGLDPVVTPLHSQAVSPVHDAAFPTLSIQAMRNACQRHMNS